MTPAAAIARRPRPPAEVTEINGSARFIPDPVLAEWVKLNYATEHAPLYDPGHRHLADAVIGFLWTNVENSRHQRRIVGQAELVQNLKASSGKWVRARAEQQMLEWFEDLPDFVITLDALYADTADDTAFCALIDHELCHCAQELDDFGQPKFDKVTGLPKFAMRGHDVEEFVSVVGRFGHEHSPAVQDLLIAVAAGPSIARVKIAQACGTCLLRAVA